MCTDFMQKVNLLQLGMSFKVVLTNNKALILVIQLLSHPLSFYLAKLEQCFLICLDEP